MNLWRYISVGALCGVGAGLLLTGLELVALGAVDLDLPLALAAGGVICSGALLGGGLWGAGLALLLRAGAWLGGGRKPILWSALVAGLAALPAAYALTGKLASGRQAAALIGSVPVRLALAVALSVALAAALGAGMVLARRLARPGGSRLLLLALALVLAGCAAGLFAADALLYRRLYLYLHGLLLGVYFTGAALAVLCLGRCLLPSPPRARPLTALVIVAAVLSLSLGAWGRSTLTREQRLRFAAMELTTVTAKLIALAPLPTRAEVPDFLGTVSSGGAARGRSAEHVVPGANVVWVTIDALRPDHLGAYGYARPTSPNIDALAGRSVRFSLAYCQTPLTCYSVPSLHTGDYLKSSLPMLGAPPPTLARILGARGYATAAFYNASIFFCDDKKATSYGERRFGFQHAETVHRKAGDLTDRVLAHLQRHRKERGGRLFLWVHYFDVHEPYTRHPEHDFGSLPMDRYDSEIAHVDRALGRLIAALSALERPTIFVLTSDHGEEFKEHGGNYHGSSLYDEQVRVPLIIGAPGLKPAEVKSPVQLVDVAPTMMRLLGMKPPRSMRGLPLVGELLGKGDPERAAFSEVHTKKMVRYRDWKLIHDYRRSTHELYDLRGDPRERRNLIGRRPREAGQMKARLDGWFDALRASASGAGGVQRPAGIDLGRIGDRRSVPLLSRLLLDPASSTRWRREAAMLLGQLQDRRAAEVLWGTVADDDGAVAAEAAIALGEMKDRRARLVLPGVLAETTDGHRLRGAIAMARVDSPAATPALVEALYSGNWELQNRAAHYLGMLGDRRAVEPLLRVGGLGHLRSRAALALGRLGGRVKDRRIMPFLLRLVRGDRKVDTRQRALAGLGYLGDRRAVRPLVRLLAGSPELTWLPETLSRLGGLGAALPGLDINPARRGLRGGWGACTRDRSLSAERYLASTWCAMTSRRASMDITTRRRPRGGRLVAHLRPLGPLTGPLKIGLRLNGRLLGGGAVRQGWQALAVDAPRAVWRKGHNRLRLELTGDGAAAPGMVAVDYVLLAPGPAGR